MGVVEGTNGGVGPLLVTHAMATSSDYNQPFITGVAYFDTDGDGFYDEGEGIGGITVKVDGSPTTLSRQTQAVYIPHGR